MKKESLSKITNQGASIPNKNLQRNNKNAQNKQTVLIRRNTIFINVRVPEPIGREDERNLERFLF